MEKLSKLEKNGEEVQVADGIFFDGDVLFVTCENCGMEQGWCGDDVHCEKCTGSFPKIEDVLDLSDFLE